MTTLSYNLSAWLAVGKKMRYKIKDACLLEHQRRQERLKIKIFPG